MTESVSYSGPVSKRPPNPEQNRFGRVGRVPTPTPFVGLGDINTYQLLPGAGSDGLTLIDTGVKGGESFEVFERGLKEFGFAVEQIERILITHAHVDHFGQARRIRDRCGAPIYAAPLEARRMAGLVPPSGDRREHVVAFMRRWGIPDELIFYENPMAKRAAELHDAVDVEGTLGDGDVVAIDDLRLEVIETPGHCPQHIVFYEPTMQWLFSGDHLLTDISPVPLLDLPEDPDTPRPKSLVRFMASLTKVEALACRMTFPSHGDVIYDHRKLIDGYRLHHERRKLQIEKKLRKGPLTPFELAKDIFAKYYETQIYPVMSEVIGHLDLLEEEGSVVIERGGATDRARIAD